MDMLRRLISRIIIIIIIIFTRLYSLFEKAATLALS